MIETDCPTCKYPKNNSRDARLTSELQDSAITPFNSLLIPDYGRIPVVKGDVTWISPNVLASLREYIALTRPSSLRICNGSVYEAQHLKEIIIKQQKSAGGNLGITPTTPGPDDEVHIYSKKSDVISHEALGIRYLSKTNYEKSKSERFAGSMSGRCMFVVPFAMGPIGGKYTLYGVQLTDDPVFVLNMRSTFRVSSSVWDAISYISTSKVIRSIHSIGLPRPVIRKNAALPADTSNPTGNFVVVRNDENEIWQFGSGFGRDADKFSRFFSVTYSNCLGFRSGWIALGAQILKITDPKNGVLHAVYASLEELEPMELPGWKFEVLSKGATWLHQLDGKLYAITPENDEMSQVAKPGNAAHLLSAKPDDYEIYSANPQETRWARDLPEISAIIFANRRTDKMPICVETNTWQEGVVLAAGARSVNKITTLLEQTPMSTMRGKVAYGFNDFVTHWLQVPGVAQTTSVFLMNLSQENGEGAKLWPGGRENSRIFEWIFTRCKNRADASNIIQTPIGKLPKTLNLDGLSGINMEALVMIDVRFWLEELAKMGAFFNCQMGTTRPKQIDQILSDLSSKL